MATKKTSAPSNSDASNKKASSKSSNVGAPKRASSKSAVDPKRGS